MSLLGLGQTLIIVNPAIATVFLHTFVAIRVGGRNPEVSRVLEQVGTKFRRLPPCFRGHTFKGGIGDFVNSAVQLQIQDGGQKVGKT